MPRLAPMNQFCCGCSLDFGAKAILIGNLLVNLFYIATATAKRTRLR